jgi:hypothetical protein
MPLKKAREKLKLPPPPDMPPAIPAVTVGRTAGTPVGRAMPRKTDTGSLPEPLSPSEKQQAASDQKQMDFFETKGSGGKSRGFSEAPPRKPPEKRGGKKKKKASSPPGEKDSEQQALFGGELEEAS